MLELMSVAARAKPGPASHAALSDFTLEKAGQITAEAVLEDQRWSLYAIDETQVVFVRLPPGWDLSTAGFVYADQFARAEHVVTMPVADFLGLADRIPAPGRLAFLFSTGRCGSTLASRILAGVPGCSSLSEPDCFTHLAAARQNMNLQQASALIWAATLWLCRGGVATDVVVIKPRSEAVLQAEAYHKAFPDASKLFLYRDLLGFANSSFKFGQRVSGRYAPPEPEDSWRAWWQMLMVDEPLSTLDAAVGPNPGVLGWESFITLMWDLRISAYLSALRQGIPFRAIHYEDLNRDRAAGTLRLLDGCRLPESALHLALAGFQGDAHEGSVSSNDTPARPLSPEERQRAAALLARLGKRDYVTERLPSSA